MLSDITRATSLSYAAQQTISIRTLKGRAEEAAERVSEDQTEQADELSGLRHRGHRNTVVSLSSPSEPDSPSQFPVCRSSRLQMLVAAPAFDEHTDDIRIGEANEPHVAHGALGDAGEDTNVACSSGDGSRLLPNQRQRGRPVFVHLPRPPSP